MLPDMFCRRMRALLGSEADAFFASYERPRAVGLRFNPRKTPDLPLDFVREPVPGAVHGC